jgi:hypothetical protein
MPALSSPWFHQTSGQAIPPTGTLVAAQQPVADKSPSNTPPMTEAEMEELNKRLSRPTASSTNKRLMAYKLDSYMDRGRHSWAKMTLFQDCKKCMWTEGGTIKSTGKIGPIKTLH